MTNVQKRRRSIKEENDCFGNCSVWCVRKIIRCLLRGEMVSCPFRAGTNHAFDAWSWLSITAISRWDALTIMDFVLYEASKHQNLQRMFGILKTDSISKMNMKKAHSSIWMSYHNSHQRFQHVFASFQHVFASNIINLKVLSIWIKRFGVGICSKFLRPGRPSIVSKGAEAFDEVRKYCGTASCFYVVKW